MPSTLCHIVLTVVSCVVNPATPPPSTAEAIAILTASLGPSRVPPPPAPEWVYRPEPPTMPAFDQEGLFPGSFAPTWWPNGYGASLLFDPRLPGSGGHGLARGSRRGGGRPDGHVTRAPLARPPVTRTPTPTPSSPRPTTPNAPLAAPSGSVRTKVGRN